MTEYKVKLTKVSRHPYLIMERDVDYRETKSMNEANKIVQMMNTVYGLDEMAEEYLYMVTLNSKCDVTGVFQIGHGSGNMCCASPRDVFTSALLSGASGIVLAHNHPSGDVEPSKYDFDFTKRMVAGGEILGVEVLDHIIVGNGNAMSMHQECPDVLDPKKIGE